VYRDAVYDSYTNDLYTRLAPGGAVILMATRWHQDDLTGRVLKDDRERGEFVRLRLPAFAEKDDPLGRVEGEALWSSRYPLGDLTRIKENLGPYPWASLYQQRPQPASGGILKREWFGITRHLPTIVKKVRYWDLAMSSKTSADYTVGLLMGLGEDGEHYILDIARGRVELHELPRFIKDVILSDGPRVGQGFEKAGYMTRSIKTIARDRDLAQYEIRAFGVDTDKLTRVLPAAARASLGLIHLAYADWNRDFLMECVSFPNGEHDDQVDAFGGAWTMINLAERKALTTVTKKWA
jgi:predicted phage terminase large subunit-like protein